MRASHARRIRNGINRAREHAAQAEQNDWENPARRVAYDRLDQAAYDRIFDRFYPPPKPLPRPPIPARYR